MCHLFRWVIHNRGNPFVRLMDAVMLISIGFMLTVTAWAQSGSAEGDRLLSAGVKAYQLGEMLDASLMWEQAVAVYARELGADHSGTLAAINNLAATYHALGQHDKALPLQEQILSLRRAKLGEDHPDTLGSMNNLANTYGDLGQHDKALVLKEQTLRLKRARLGEGHPDTLGSMNNLANTYSALGLHDKALALDEQTLKHMRVKLGEDHPSTLASMGNLAVSYGALGQHDKALALQELTLKLRRANLGEDHPDTLGSMSNLAKAYSDLGQHDKALSLQELSLTLLRVKFGEDHPSTLASMNNLAATHHTFGQHDKALALQEKTLRFRRAKLGEDHPNTLDTMANLAVTYGDIGQLDKALTLNEQTLKLRRDKLGEDHPSTLDSMNNLATTYGTLGQYDKALALLEQVLRIRRINLGEDHPDTLSSMGNLAITYGALGQRDKALILKEQTLILMQGKLGEDHPDTLTSMYNLAITYGEIGQHDKALALNEQTLKLRRAKLGEVHPDTLSSMNNLAATHDALNQRDKAVALIPTIVLNAERLRAQPGLAAEQRQSLFARYSDNYLGYTKAYASAGRLEEAFNLGDLSKARTLTDGIKMQVALRALPEAEQLKLQASETRAKQLRAQIEKFGAKSTRDSGALLNIQRQLDAHNESHRQFVTGLSRRYLKYAQLSDLKSATATQAKQLIGPNEVFVSYLIRTDGMAQVFVLDGDGHPRWVDLGRIQNHAKTVAAYRELVTLSSNDGYAGQLVALRDGGYQWLERGESVPKGAKVVDDGLKTLVHYWHDTLIKPILPIAGRYKRWIVSPDKDLALLPFDTLVESFVDAGIAGQTVVHSHAITLVQSFTVFALLKQREAEYSTLARPKQLLAMGDAVYGEHWAEDRGLKRRLGVRGFAANSQSTAASVSRGYVLRPLSTYEEQAAMRTFVWENLPGTANEIKAIRAVFSGDTRGDDPARDSGAEGNTLSERLQESMNAPRNMLVTEIKGESPVDSYLGLQASEGTLQKLNRDGKLKDYRYLLFSAHGYLARNPELSSLVLSRQGNPPEIDGYVTASEWPLYDVRSDLTVLSACDTGVGRTQAGESVMGLPYALFVAGNKNTLLSLWPVDDDATAEFMRRFFTKMKAGIAQSDALSETKQEFRRHPKWNSPRFWAAFVLYGV